jgi:GntR family transcriptional regulator
MRWVIDYHSGVPIYLQFVHQAKAAVASGTLKDGDQLPSVRVLAEELRINRNTVAKAYSELENEGVIETRPGSGCFVTTSVSPFRRSVRLDLLARSIDALIVQAHHLQLSDDTLRSLLDDRLREFKSLRRAAEGER